MELSSLHDLQQQNPHQQLHHCKKECTTLLESNSGDVRIAARSIII